MRRMITFLTLMVSLAGGLPTFSFAQTGLSQVARGVREIDKNFDAADKNKDGKLTRDEASSGATPMIAKHFDAIDFDHKGYVTKDNVHTFIRTHLTQNRGPVPAGSSP